MYKYYIASYSDIPTSNRQMLASEKLRICNPLLLYKENNWSMKLRNVLWYFLAHLFNMNKYVFKQYDIIKNNRIISSAKVVSYIPFFRFMSRDGIHICSCYTIPEERGKGYYPYLISKIMSDFPDKVCYMMVNESNLPSIRGIEKVGFTLFAIGKKRNGIYSITRRIGHPC